MVIGEIREQSDQVVQNERDKAGNDSDQRPPEAKSVPADIRLGVPTAGFPEFS